MPLVLRYWFTRVLFVILRCLQQAWNRPRPRHHRSYLKRKARAPVPPQSLPCAAPGRRKPDWVREELIHDAARYHDASCRKLADLFNRRHAHSDGITIGKTFVSGVLRQHQQDIRLERKTFDRRRPGPGAKNVVWAMDGTGKTDEAGKTHFLLGILDHGTRCCLRLRTLRDKSSVTILRSLLDTIECHGKPRAIRTDNEAIFTSRLFRFGLRLLGIRHQTIEPHCPWQNGRVERFFGTLKAKLDGLGFRDASHLDAALVQFRYWYNHVRPHQHLFGRTPTEVWNGIDVFRRPARLCLFYEAWGGRLQGELLVP